MLNWRFIDVYIVVLIVMLLLLVLFMQIYSWNMIRAETCQNNIFTGIFVQDSFINMAFCED